ncbi:hypothetical protein GC207_12905 [bacterium]|nr:hypothetical protein [bacterium]
MERRSQKLKLGIAMVAIVGALGLLPACSTLDRAYDQQVTMEQQPVVHVYTNTVVVTNYVPTIIERTNVVLATNALSGVVTGRATIEPIATNFITQLQTNFVPVYETNVVQVPVTNLVAKPAAESFIQGAATITNTFVPGLGGLIALALGGLYHGYRQVRNKKVNEALVQGVETARAILETTPQGQAADGQFVKWLKEHQKEAGVFAVISDLVDQHSDNPAAKLTAQEILDRIQKAQQG